MEYDYLVVGSGLYGAVFAHEAKDRGKSVLVVDKRPYIAGNIYTENIEGINVHKYGAHIFHTNNKNVWNYIIRFAEFNRFTNSPVANYKGELYSLPFNMYTFNKMWGVVTPEEAAAKIEEQRKEITHKPRNLEEQAISLVGRDIYEKLIKGYTEKQWGRDCKDLPAFIIKRLPVRLTFDNRTIWNTSPSWTHWQTRWFILAPLMPTLTINWAHWNTVLFALKTSCWTSPIFRGTLLSTTLTGRHHGLASLSISGSSSAKMRTVMTSPGPSSAVSILLSGSPETSRIIL